MFGYKIAGLHVQSDIEIQAAGQWIGAPGVPDVVIRIVCGEVAADGFVPVSPTMDVHKNGLVRLHVDSVGSFFVLGGRYVGVAPRSDASERDVECLLMEAVLSILCAQRNMVALNGTCVLAGEQAVALLGPSGIGKTALATGLNKLGHALISDGISIFSDEQNEPTAIPTIGIAKVWEDTFESLGIAYAGLAETRTSQRRYVFPVSNSHLNGPVPISKVILLEPCIANTIGKISPQDAAWRMLRCLKTPKLSQLYGATEAMLGRLETVADRALCFRMGRNLSDNLSKSVSILEEAVHW